MTWAKLDDRANEHRKQLAAGAEACWLWACGLMYANRQPARDGFIPEQVLPMLYPMAAKARARLAAKLVEVGLWDRADGGYRVHQFEDWNETAEERAARTAVASRRSALRYDPDLYSKLKHRDGERCRYCGEAVNFTDRRGPRGGTYDHVHPISKGGGDGIENLVVCCRECNSRKGSRSAAESGMNLRPEPSSELDPELGFHGSLPLRSAPLPALPSQSESSARASEVRSDFEPEPKLTICPLDLREKAESAGILRDFVDKYQTEPEQIREVIREFVSYWSIGGGVGRKHANWPRKLREHLRRACEKPGGLKPIGELEHEQHGGGGPSRGVRAAKAADAAAMALMREAHATGGK